MIGFDGAAGVQLLRTADIATWSLQLKIRPGTITGTGCTRAKACQGVPTTGRLSAVNVERLAPRSRRKRADPDRERRAYLACLKLTSP